MQIGGIGRIIFWSGGSLWIGLAVAPIDLHAHHALQIGFGLNGPLQFRSGNSGPWVEFAGAFVPADLPHQFQAPGRQVASIFLEPETPLGRRLTDRFGSGAITRIEASESARVVEPLAAAYASGREDDDLVEESEALLGRLAGTDPPRRPTDSRILRAIDWIGRHLDEPIALSDVAAVAGLSTGRLRHVFVAETGVAFRRYVLWTRLNRALELGFGGASWTEAAHAANFADSAHLTRTSRRMFGVAPTSMRIDLTSVSDRLLA